MAAGEEFYIRAREGDRCSCGRVIPEGAPALYWSSDWKFGPGHRRIVACSGCDPDIMTKAQREWEKEQGTS